MTPPIPRVAFLDSVPSIEDQAKAGGFSAGIFDWGRANQPNVAYFNSSLVERPDGLWLIARRSRNDPKLRVGINDIVRIELDGLTPKQIVPVAMPRQFSDEHFEDPRAIQIGNETWISCCDFLWSSGAMRWTGAHQVLCKFNEGWSCKARLDIPYGKNGNEIGSNKGHEKCWLWFSVNGRPHLIYWADPHTVVEFTEDFRVQKEHITKADTGWTFGEIRGGTPPTQIGDEYWSFFHSSFPVNPAGRNTRRYVMGAYAFSTQPPFGMTRISRKPILQGSYHNRWSMDKPPCCYPCGSLFRDGEWLLTFGVNDLDTGWAKINHSYIAGETVCVKP